MSEERALVEKSAIEKEADGFLVNLSAYEITNNDQRIKAEDLIKAAKDLEDQVAAYLDPPRARAYKEYQYHKKRLDDAINPIQEARKAFKQKCIAYDKEQERIRQEEEARLREIARQQEEERRLQEALAAEQDGDKESAEAIINEPITPIEPVVQKTAPNASRLTAGRTTYSAEVVNLPVFIQAVAKGLIPNTAIEPNMTFLNNQARALKEALNYPGCRVIKKTV